MAERTVVIDHNEEMEDPAQAAEQLRQRAERAEAELAKLKASGSQKARQGDDAHTSANSSDSGTKTTGRESGEEELRKDSMMAHLLDALDHKKDIGHYGRLVFAKVARHFLPHEEVLAWMMKDKDVDEEKATLMLRQVEGKDYNPPRRDKILSYQAQQEFPILPNANDPDCGNLYRNLKFPDEVYKHIGHYQEEKMEAGE